MASTTIPLPCKRCGRTAQVPVHPDPDELGSVALVSMHIHPQDALVVALTWTCTRCEDWNAVRLTPGQRLHYQIQRVRALEMPLEACEIRDLGLHVDDAETDPVADFVIDLGCWSGIVADALPAGAA